ncbi:MULTISPECIES: hypothetical protein [unclassified Tenacibaculum]|uniref:hypothetical protein n=1 Tax=unclassified Tenacibaculum TaxID=2635139 RepID=UPI001F17EA91|nr:MULTISPECIES: hypothetical protein [unclassified Tenacibaculum]MCF2875418.1 hypothetical protein [Tenacibaculum sp. Cn5-1]MCF2935494.1 hypothetical protein [Tenacibaculum sp. Cn5-34]MCG7512054.1 hypothetical protein [Tenacibaculum sp. Cn5-46]
MIFHSFLLNLGFRYRPDIEVPKDILHYDFKKSTITYRAKSHKLHPPLEIYNSKNELIESFDDLYQLSDWVKSLDS